MASVKLQSGPTLSVDELPDMCPICHSHIETHQLLAFACDVAGDHLEAVFRCPRNACQSLFIARFTRTSTHGVHSLTALVPRTAEPPALPAEIRSLSPTFAEVLRQASHAEAIGLDQLHGMGLRKALEFLVKDFAKSRNPGKEAVIEAQPLGQCIKEFIDDIKVRIASERASWLGNDETHYVRKWAALDITDLTTLVTMTVNAIHNVILADKYREAMPSAEPPSA